MMDAGRRDVLRGAAVVAAGAAAYGATRAVVGEHDLPSRDRSYPFEGPHQQGILTPQQQAASFCSFDVTAGTPAQLRSLLQVLTDRIRFLASGGRPPAGPLQSVPSDSGTLGPVVPADGLTVTVGVGSSLFDDRFGLRDRKPARLKPMPVFPDDRIGAASPLHGDVSLQVCADSRDTVLHAVRDLTRHTRGAMQPRWRFDGFTSPPRPTGTQRNHLGFRDGISNPDVSDEAVADALLWTRGGHGGEPDWVDGGTYQVIRSIRMRVEFWDRVSLQEQQQMIGRARDSGAPLDGSDEDDVPDYAADPDGHLIPLDAHIRLANPRTPETESSRILRRSYNYDRGFDEVGDLDVGLVFCCYNRDVVGQFEATQHRLAGEPLVDYVSPEGGGYFFVLPGVRDAADRLGSGLV